MAATHGLPLWYLDIISQAFLQAKIEEDAYMDIIIQSINSLTSRDTLPNYKNRTLNEQELTPCTQEEMKEYQSILGNYLTWLAINTRPDLLLFSTNAARASKAPYKAKLRVVRQSLGYLQNKT